jgi:bifunctional DNase/RNase
VVITELRESTYYAEIRLSLGGRQHVVSARPSDAIALATRVGTPIYAEEALLDAEGIVLPPEEEPEEELVDQFREFLQGIRPEDFGS